MSDSARPDRRRAPRRTPKINTEARSYRGPLALGPDIAVAVLDVSEIGAKLLLKVELSIDQEVEVHLEHPAYRVVKVPGRIVWCRPSVDTTFVAGVEFHKRLNWGDFTHLAKM